MERIVPSYIIAWRSWHVWGLPFTMGSENQIGQGKGDIAPWYSEKELEGKEIPPVPQRVPENSN